MHIIYRHNMKELLKEIDVSDNDYEKAVNRYRSISSFLDNSDLNRYGSEIFIQGSFKLGTAIKPITEEGSYDVDMVLSVGKIKKTDLSQSDFKDKVGKIIKNYVSINGMKNQAKDGKRCWTLDYVDEHNFHVDILPTLVDERLNQLYFTNKNNSNYQCISDFWDITNPKGYYQWFINCSNFNYVKQMYAKEKRMSIEEIPDYKIKTHLQRIVQIFKRHAEIMFEDNAEYKPSSIIITTLCTKAYCKINNRELYFEDLLKAIADNMCKELDCVDGKYCVLNPVCLQENLSQKWKDKEYYNYFLKWIEQLKFDLNIDNGVKNKQEEFNLLKRSLFINKNNVDLQNNLSLLPYHKKMIWRDKIWKDVQIKAYIVQSNGLTKKIESGELLPKNLNLKFVVEADYLREYDIYWQITNTGYEALKVKQLRGDFYDSEIESGLKFRRENTSYSGKHYVEAFLVDKNNFCVGRSYPFIVNIK